MLLAIRNNNLVIPTGSILIFPEFLNKLVAPNIPTYKAWLKHKMAIEAFIKMRTKRDSITPEDYREVKPGELLIFHDKSNKNDYRQPVVKNNGKPTISRIIQSEALIYEKIIRDTYILLKVAADTSESIILYPNQLLCKWENK